VDDDISQELPEEIAAQIDRRGVMREAAEHVEALHHATKRLGDALIATGLSGRALRSEDALLSLLDDELPDITVDELITRLAEFGADTGPVWLHGDERDLAAFHDEVAVLGDVIGPLRAIAQHLRMGTAGRSAGLPIEQAFASGLVGTQLYLLGMVLRDLELLAPVMAPLAPDEWEASRGFELNAHLRDFVPEGQAQRERYQGTFGVETLPATLLRRGQALGSWLQAHKLAAIAGVSLVLVTGIALAQVAARSEASHPSAVVVVPATVSLTCSSRPATVTLTNPGKQSLTWQAEPPASLSVVPARGALLPGQRAALRIAARGNEPGSGAIVIVAADGTASIPYTITCRQGD
jgi:hypothetical protein